MSDEIKRERWAAFFDGFSKRNHSRSTQLEVFGESGAQEAERHLPLNGISVDEVGSDAPRIEILLGDVSREEERHLTHAVLQVTTVYPKAGAEGQDEALEIEDADGTKTLLRFEHAMR